MKFTLFKRYMYFFYYTKKSQIINRILSRLKRPLSQRYVVKKKYDFNYNLNYITVTINATYKDPIEILQNKFTFLNSSKKLDNLDIWYLNESDDLWNFHLNYFDYLADLLYEYNLLGNFEYLDKGKELIDKWIKGSAVFNKVTWAPYTISLRLINWISYYSNLVKSNLIEKVPTNALDSIFKQNEYLKLNLEHDVLGNHLFENIKTIIITEHFFNKKMSAQKYIYKMNKLLSKQLYKDGCHIEKSTSYHIILLSGVLDILEILEPYDYNLDDLTAYGYLMYRFYKEIRYSENDYPLLNDSNFTMTERIVDIDSKALRVFKTDSINKKVKTLNILSGYFVYNYNYMRMVVDLGDLGPDYLLAHSHNDILNFELSYFNEKYIVDTGVYDYNFSDNRFYSKSTSAHNTVKVSNLEQSDVWGTFRIAYRPKKVTHKIYNHDNLSVYSGSYNYKKKYLHNRKFFMTINNTIVISDKLITNKVFSYKSFLNFSPNVLIIKKEDYLILKNTISSLRLYLFVNNEVVKTTEIKVYDTKYFPEFGIEITRKSLLHEIDSKRSGFVIVTENVVDIKIENNILFISYLDRNIEQVELI
jgi:uncharacterized heparinase superfamily protein